jgi:hypothetical protein
MRFKYSLTPALVRADAGVIGNDVEIQQGIFKLCGFVESGGLNGETAGVARPVSGAQEVCHDLQIEPD